MSRIARTHLTLRVLMAALALALPLALLLGAGPQDSISAYYRTPMRDVLTGALCAVGLALVVYRGFGRDEDRLLDVAGVAVVAVALFPIGHPVHGPAAALFFVALGVCVLITSGRTLTLISDPLVRAAYRTGYRGAGAAMIGLPGLAWLMGPLYWVETAGAVVFGCYWLAKTVECWRYGADR